MLGVSGGLGGGEMHFSNRLEQEAASTFGLLAADAIVQHLGLMLARVVWSFPANGGAKVFQSGKHKMKKSTNLVCRFARVVNTSKVLVILPGSLEHSLILGSVVGFFLVPGLPLLFLFALVLLTRLGPSLVTVVHRMGN